ncbi:MAG: hypothetical protein ABR953_02890 [Candidatus Acidiferrales bacterium]|jgi:hypothetical protein
MAIQPGNRLGPYEILAASVGLDGCHDGRGVDVHRFCFFNDSLKRLANVPLSLREKLVCVRVPVE